MKKAVIAVAAISLVMGFSSVSFGKSEISGKVMNKAKVDKSANVAIGKGATANMGSVTIKNANIKGMISNNADVSKSANVAIGQGSEASMGSVTVE